MGLLTVVLYVGQTHGCKISYSKVGRWKLAYRSVMITTIHAAQIDSQPKSIMQEDKCTFNCLRN